MLGIVEEELLPPTLHLLDIAHLHSVNQLVEIAFILAVSFNGKVVLGEQVLPYEGARQLLLNTIVRRNSWTYHHFQLSHFLTCSDLVYLFAALHRLFGKNQSVDFLDFDGDPERILQEKADDLYLGFDGFDKCLDIFHPERPGLQHFLRLFLSQQLRS